MKVSLIIPVRYRADLTAVCIDSVVKYTDIPHEIVLVQEGIDEEITELLKSYDAKFVHNKEPKGFAGAMNSGLAVSEGDYLCFLNNDVVVIPGWLECMMKAFEDKQVGLVAPVLSEGNKRQHLDAREGREKEFDYVEDPLSLKGVCFLVRRSVIDNVGTWDESFGMGGGDDSDFCYRIAKAGYKLVIARKSFLYHYGSASFRELFDNDIPRSKKYAEEQFSKFKKKHSGGRKTNVDGEKPRVYVAVFPGNGWVWHELSLVLLHWSHDSDMTVKIRYYPFLSPLDNARNQAVKDSLEDYWDYVLQIDNDIVPPVDCLRELLAADKDIIAPLCMTMKPDSNGLMVPMPVAHRYDKDGKYRPYYGRGVEETDVVTGGMFLVKREVYEKLERPFEFTYHKDGTVIYSEDFVFSQKCQKAGYKLYTHYGMICKHMKILDVKGINDLLVHVTNLNERRE